MRKLIIEGIVDGKESNEPERYLKIQALAAKTGTKQGLSPVLILQLLRTRNEGYLDSLYFIQSKVLGAYIQKYEFEYSNLLNINLSFI